LAATNGLLNGEVDMSTAAEFVLVGKALAKSGIKTLCSIDKFQQIYIVGNKDHGVNTLSDLQGKRVGLSLKTASEFYFGRFLQLNGLTLAAVTLVNISPSETVSAFANGTVDAVVTWQPNINSLQETVGNNTILWGAQSGQVAYCLALSTNEWIIDHPKVANRFLKSLLQAEDYLVGNIEQAKSRIQSILGYDQGYVNKIWSDHQFSLSLDQSLILALEDESRWEIGNQLASTTVVPNFLEYIYLDGLSVVRPESVTIIR
jgi:ABC-type nitrate/sulfonate/bicarbonate transport system substrate-binding protein